MLSYFNYYFFFLLSNTYLGCYISRSRVGVHSIYINYINYILLSFVTCVYNLGFIC